MTVEKLHFKTSSGIKSIVGKDLITDKYVAIFELVKNSYDAGATQVTITFDKDKITILDDGHGMSKDDLVNKWLNLAYSEKKEGTLSKKDRVYVGSKGIGRFSADRLGSKLKITTKVLEENCQHEIWVDWDRFDENLENLFEEISLDYNEVNLNSSKEKTFTKIEIFNLHESWSHDDIEKVKESLRRLKNPFVDDDGFKILFIDSTDLLEVKEYIKSNIASVLKDKSITVEADFKEKINIKLFDRGQKIYEIEADNSTVLKTCPIKANINYLTISAKAAFTKKMRVEPVNYGNIFIYKNNFRVLPYGDTDYDLFGLNMRKTQGYNRYLGTRELIGFIEIFDKNNKFFKETSSRNSGFVNSIYLAELENLFMDYIIRPLESYMGLISWGEFKVDNSSIETKEVFFDEIDLSETEKFKKYISRKKELIFFKNDLNFENYQPAKRLEKIVENVSREEKKKIEPIIKEVKKQVSDLKKASEQSEKIVKEKQKSIEILERQAKNLAMKRSEVSYAEQLNHHLTLFSKRLNSVVEKLADLEEQICDLDQKNELKVRTRTLKRTADEMVAFRDILSKSDLDAKSPQTINWIDLLEWRIQTTAFPIKAYVVKKVNSDNPWLIKVNILEFVLMVDNFINNAEEHGAKFIEFEFKDNSLLVKSDSKLIDDKLLEKVFELGVSTKHNGTGIGLNQIEKSLRKLNMSINVKNENNLVCFEIFRGK
ncbi:ATP-binding protein [Acinetobacter pittii]